MKRSERVCLWGAGNGNWDWRAAGFGLTNFIGLFDSLCSAAFLTWALCFKVNLEN